MHLNHLECVYQKLLMGKLWNYIFLTVTKAFFVVNTLAYTTSDVHVYKTNSVVLFFSLQAGMQTCPCLKCVLRAKYSWKMYSLTNRESIMEASPLTAAHGVHTCLITFHFSLLHEKLLFFKWVSFAARGSQLNSDEIFYSAKICKQCANVKETMHSCFLFSVPTLVDRQLFTQYGGEFNLCIFVARAH